MRCPSALPGETAGVSGFRGVIVGCVSSGVFDESDQRRGRGRRFARKLAAPTTSVEVASAADQTVPFCEPGEHLSVWAWVDAAMGDVEVQGPDEAGSFVTTAAGVQGAIGYGPTRELAVNDLKSALSVWAGCKLSEPPWYGRRVWVKPGEVQLLSSC